MFPITVFTPTYNRANLLPRLYQSLCKQTCKDFEWLIVDDGSTDDTFSVVKGFHERKNLNIRYFKKPNGGKHTAINLGAKLAEGELFFIADSDDYLPEDSIESVINCWEGLKKQVTTDVLSQFGGVCGLDGYADGTVVGSGLPQSILDTTTIELRDRYGVTGDMKEVFLTSVMREFPFPEVKSERFCPEALVWNRIGKKYKLRFFNTVIYIAEYQEGGITAGITKARMNSPRATMMTYSEWFNYDISLKKKLRMAINYWRFAFCSEKRDVKISSWGNTLAPIGWLMHLRDRRRLRG